MDHRKVSTSIWGAPMAWEWIVNPMKTMELGVPRRGCSMSKGSSGNCGLLAPWISEMRVVCGPEAEPCKLGLHPWTMAKLYHS